MSTYPLLSSSSFPSSSSPSGTAPTFYDSYSIVTRGLGSFGLLLQVREGTVLTVYGFSRKSVLASSEYNTVHNVNPIRKGDILAGINNIPLQGLDLDIQFSILATAEAFLHRDICLHFYRPITEEAFVHPPLIAVNENMDNLYHLLSSSQSNNLLLPLVPPPPVEEIPTSKTKTSSSGSKVRKLQNKTSASNHGTETLDDHMDDNEDEDEDDDDNEEEFNDDETDSVADNNHQRGGRKSSASASSSRATSPYGNNNSSSGSKGRNGKNNKRDSTTDGPGSTNASGDGTVKEKRKRRGGRHQLTASGACAWAHEQGQLSFRLLVSACVSLGGVQKTALSHIVHSHYSNLSNWLKGVLSLQPTSRMISLLYRWLEQGCPLPPGVARPRVTTHTNNNDFSIETYGTLQNIELFRSMAQNILFQGMQPSHVAWTWIDGSRSSMLTLWAFHDQQIEIETKEKEAELLEKANTATNNSSTSKNHTKAEKTHSDNNTSLKSSVAASLPLPPPIFVQHTNSNTSAYSVPSVRTPQNTPVHPGDTVMNNGLGISINSSVPSKGTSTGLLPAKSSVHAAYNAVLAQLATSSSSSSSSSSLPTIPSQNPYLANSSSTPSTASTTATATLIAQKGGRKRSLPPQSTSNVTTVITDSTVPVPTTASTVHTTNPSLSSSTTLNTVSVSVLPTVLPPAPVPMEAIHYSEEKGYRSLVDVPVNKWKDAFAGSSFISSVITPIVEVITPPVSTALLSSSSASVLLNPSTSTTTITTNAINASVTTSPTNLGGTSASNSMAISLAPNLLTMPDLSLISTSLPPSPTFGSTAVTTTFTSPPPPEIKVHINTDVRIRCWFGLWEIIRTEENRGDNQRAGPILIRQIVGPRGDYEAALADGNALPYYGIGNNILEHIKNHKMLFLEDQKPKEEPSIVASETTSTQLLPKPKVVTTKGKWTADNHGRGTDSTADATKPTVSSSVSYFLDPRLHLQNQKKGIVQSYEQLHVLGHHKGDGKMRLGDRYQADLPPLQPKPVRKDINSNSTVPTTITTTTTTTVSLSSSSSSSSTAKVPVSPREPTELTLPNPFDDGIPGVTQDTLMWSASTYELAMIRSAAAAQAAAQAQRAKEKELERERRRIAREAALVASSLYGGNEDDEMGEGGGSSGQSSDAEDTNDNNTNQNTNISSSTNHKRRSTEVEADTMLDDEDDGLNDDEESETVAQRLSGMRRTRRSGPTGKGTGTSTVSGTAVTSGSARGNAQGLSTSSASPPVNILSSLARYVQFLKWNRLPDPLQEQGDDVLALTILQAYQFSFPRAAEAATAIVNTLNYESNKLNDADIAAIRRAQVSTVARKRNRNTNEGAVDNNPNDENALSATSSATSTATNTGNSQQLSFGTARTYVASGVTTVILAPTLRPYSRREALEFQDDMIKELSDHPPSAASTTVPESTGTTMEDTDVTNTMGTTTLASTTTTAPSSSSSSSSSPSIITVDTSVGTTGTENCPKHPFAALGWGIRGCVQQLPTVTFRTIALASGCTLALLVNFVLGKIGLGASSRTRVLAWIRENAPIPIKRTMLQAVQTWTADDVTVDLAAAKAFINALSSGKVLAEIDPVVAKIVGNDLDVDETTNNEGSNTNDNGEEGTTNNEETGTTSTNRKRVRLDTAALLGPSVSSSNTSVTANLLFPSAIGAAAAHSNKNKITTILPKVYYALVETITGTAGRFCWNTLDRTFFEMAIELHGKKLRRTNAEIVTIREAIGAKDASTVEAVPPLPNPDGPVPLTLACRYALARTSNPDVADTIAHFYHFWKPNIEYKEWRRRVSFNPLVKEGRVRIGGTYESTLSDYLAALNKENKDDNGTSNPVNGANTTSSGTTVTGVTSTVTTPSNVNNVTASSSSGSVTNSGNSSSNDNTKPTVPVVVKSEQSTTSVTAPSSTVPSGGTTTTAVAQPAKRGRKPNNPTPSGTPNAASVSTASTGHASTVVNNPTSSSTATLSSTAVPPGTTPTPPVPERKKPGPKPGSTRTPKIPPTNPTGSVTTSSTNPTTGTNTTTDSATTVSSTTTVPAKPPGLPRGPKPKPKPDAVSGSSGTTSSITTPSTTNPAVVTTTTGSAKDATGTTGVSNHQPRKPGKKPGRKPGDGDDNDASTTNNKSSKDNDDDNDDNDANGNSAGTTAAALASAASTLNMQYAEIFKQLGLDKDDDDDDDYVDEDYFDEDPRNSAKTPTAKDAEEKTGGETTEPNEGETTNTNADGHAMDTGDGNNGEEEIVETEGPALDLDDALFDIHIDDCPVCDHGANLVACASCERSYHFTCVGQSTPLSSIYSLWTCPTCIYRYAGDRQGLKLAREAVHKEIERNAARKRYSFCRRRYFRADCARRTVARIFRELSLQTPPLLTAFLLSWASTLDTEDLIPHTRIGSPLLQSKVLNIDCPTEALTEAENSLSIVDSGLKKVLEYMENRRQYELKMYEEYQKRKQQLIHQQLSILPSVSVAPTVHLTVVEMTGNNSSVTNSIAGTGNPTGKQRGRNAGRGGSVSINNNVPNNSNVFSPVDMGMTTQNSIVTGKGRGGRSMANTPPVPTNTFIPPNIPSATINRTTTGTTKRARNSTGTTGTTNNGLPKNTSTSTNTMNNNDPSLSSTSFTHSSHSMGSSANTNVYSNYGMNNSNNISSSLPHFSGHSSAASSSGQRASPSMMNQGGAAHFRYHHDDMAGEDDDEEDDHGMHAYDNLHNNRSFLPSHHQPPSLSSALPTYPYGMGPVITTTTNTNVHNSHNQHHHPPPPPSQPSYGMGPMMNMNPSRGGNSTMHSTYHPNVYQHRDDMANDDDDDDHHHHHNPSSSSGHPHGNSIRALGYDSDEGELV